MEDKESPKATENEESTKAFYLNQSKKYIWSIETAQFLFANNGPYLKGFALGVDTFEERFTLGADVMK